MSIQVPILLPKSAQLLTNPSGGSHPLVERSSLKLVAWLLSGTPYLRREFQATLVNSSLTLEEREPQRLMSQPGRNGMCGVVTGKLIPLIAL